MPTWIGADGDHVVFVTGPESRKARNLELDPRVCVSIVDPDQPTRMAHLRGRLDQRVDGDAGWAIVDRLSNAYLGQPYSRDEERVAFLVTIDHVVSNDFGGPPPIPLLKATR